MLGWLSHNWIIILLIILFCCCGNGNSISGNCGCGNSCGC